MKGQALFLKIQTIPLCTGTASCLSRKLTSFNSQNCSSSAQLAFVAPELHLCHRAALPLQEVFCVTCGWGTAAETEKVKEGNRDLWVRQLNDFQGSGFSSRWTGDAPSSSSSARGQQNLEECVFLVPQGSEEPQPAEAQPRPRPPAATLHLCLEQVNQLELWLLTAEQSVASAGAAMQKGVEEQLHTYQVGSAPPGWRHSHVYRWPVTCLYGKLSEFRSFVKFSDAHSELPGRSGHVPWRLTSLSPVRRNPTPQQQRSKVESLSRVTRCVCFHSSAHTWAFLGCVRLILSRSWRIGRTILLLQLCSLSSISATHTSDDTVCGLESHKTTLGWRNVKTYLNSYYN